VSQQASLPDPTGMGIMLNPGRCAPCGISDWHPEARGCQMARCPFGARDNHDASAARDACPVREPA